MGPRIGVRWELDLVDKATRPILARDRTIRKSIDDTGKAWARQAQEASKAANVTTSASRRMAIAARAEGRAAAAAGVDVGALNREQAEHLREGQRIIAQSSRVEAAYRREGRAARAAADEHASAAARMRASLTAGAGVIGRVSGGIGRGAAAVGAGAAAASGRVALGAGFVGAAALAAAAKAGSDYNRVIDAQRVAFTTLLGSQRRALDFMRQLRALAQKSPVLDVESTGNAARTLLGYGVSLKTVIPLTKALGDMSAATGKSIGEVMPQAAMAIGQIASKGKLQAEELNQLAESVGLSRGRIRKALGMTRAEFESTFTPGNSLSATRAIPAILKAMEDQSAGAAERLSKTTAGRIDRAKEVLKQRMGELSRPLYDAVGGLAGNLADKLADVDFTKAGKALRDGLTAAIDAAATGVAQGKDLLGGLTGRVRRTSTTSSTFVGGREIETTTFHDDPTAAQKVGQVVRGVADKIVGLAKTVGPAALEAGRQLLDAFKPAVPFLQNVLLPLLLGIGKGVLGSVVVAFKILVPVIKIVATALGAIGTKARPLRGVFEGIGTVIGFVFAGPILKGIGLLGRLGGVFRVVAAAARILVIPVRLQIALFRGLFGLVGKVASKFANLRVIKAMVQVAFDDAVTVVKRFPGRFFTAALSIVKRVASAFSGLAHRIADAVRSKLGDLTAFFGRVGRAIVAAIVDAIKSAPGAVRDAISSIVPKGVRGAPGKVKDFLGLRRGGRIGRYGDGGLVPAFVSPGERVIEPGGVAWTVPGQPTAADSVSAHLSPGAAVLTADGQARMAAGASLGAALAMQAPHFRAGGVVPGRYSATAYGPPWGGIQGTGVTRTGVNLRNSPHVYGIAVDPSMITLGSQVYVWPNPFGYSGRFRAFDTGGAIDGRRLDFYDWRGRDAQKHWGRRQVEVSTRALRRGGRKIATHGVGSPGALQVLGESARRGSLLDDSFAQGLAAGQAGLTRALIRKTGNPIIDALREQIGAAGPSSGGQAERPQGNDGQPAGTGTIRALRSLAARTRVPYVYGGGHGGFSRHPASLDCSGYVSHVLHYGGADPRLKSPMATGPLIGYGRSGPGRHVTIHVRNGGAGGGHTMLTIDGAGYSSGNRATGRLSGRNDVSASYLRSLPVKRHPIGMRTGGVVPSPGFGNRLSLTRDPLKAGVDRALTFAGGSFEALDAAIGRAVESKLLALRDAIRRKVQQGGPAAVVRRLQGMLDLIDFELGRRVGRILDVVASRTQQLDTTRGYLERAARKSGMDPSSAAGIGMQIAVSDRFELPVLQANVRSLQSAVKRAQRAGNRSAVRDLQQQLSDAYAAVDEALTTQIERRRDLVRQSAQERVDTAGFGVDVAQAIHSGLETRLRGRTGGADSPRALLAKAIDIREQLVPALEAQKTALDAQFKALSSIGDTAGARQAFLGILQAGNDIASAMQDAADLVKQAALDTAQARVDVAAHGETMGNLGLARLELEQRIAGTFEGGGAARAAFIRDSILPAIDAEISALQDQQAVAQEQGDSTLATQIAEAIAGKQNDKLQAIVDATEQTAENTDPRRVGGGTLAFAFGGDTLTDVDVGA